MGMAISKLMSVSFAFMGQRMSKWEAGHLLWLPSISLILSSLKNMSTLKKLFVYFYLCIVSTVYNITLVSDVQCNGSVFIYLTV